MEVAQTEARNGNKMVSGLFDVSQETVLITGTSGQMGSEYSRAFCEQGAKVFGLDISSSIHTEELLNAYPSNFYYLQCDVTKKASIQTARDFIVDETGPPTVLINNAGIDSPPNSPSNETGRFEDYPEASWDKVLEVNLKGVYLCCQEFGGLMAENGGGSVVNVASIYGLLSPDQSIYDYKRQKGEVFFKPVAYSASKSGILNLTRYLAVYWAKQKVRVNSLVIAGVYNHQDSEFVKAYCDRIPIGRMARQDQYNGTLFYLSSRASEYMTGHSLIVDGGWTAI